MRKLLLTTLLLAAAFSVKAQVSYTEMQIQRAEEAARYTSPAWLTPLAGTDKFVDFDGREVLAYDYTNPKNGKVIFKARSKDHNLMSFCQSPDGTMAIYEVFDQSNPRKEIYRHSYTSIYYIACADGSTIKIDDVRDISFSPDSKHLAMSYNNDIFIYDLATNEIYNITDDGKWNHIINGTTDWVYEEEYGFTKAYALL